MIENDKLLWNGKRRQTNTKCFIDILLEIIIFKILSFSRKRQTRTVQWFIPAYDEHKVKYKNVSNKYSINI